MKHGVNLDKDYSQPGCTTFKSCWFDEKESLLINYSILFIESIFLFEFINYCPLTTDFRKASMHSVNCSCFDEESMDQYVYEIFCPQS